MLKQPFQPFKRRYWIRRLMKRMIHLGFDLLTDLQIIGQDNIPPNEPLLVVGNHFSFIDPVVVIHTMPRSIEFLGGKTLPNSPSYISWIPRLWGYVPVYRGSSSRDAIARAKRILDSGGLLGIFPEGGSWAKVLRPPRPGAALLAARTGVRILPLGIDGLVNVFPFLRKGKRAEVTVRIGEPFGPFEGDLRGRADRQKLDEFGHTIMQKIAALIPAQYRGYYSDDPTIREAARGTEIYPWQNVAEI